eukprot:SAG11_NODE_1396_length_5036_cov_2.382824_8_plen_90_part_00
MERLYPFSEPPQAADPMLSPSDSGHTLPPREPISEFEALEARAQLLSASSELRSKVAGLHEASLLKRQVSAEVCTHPVPPARCGVHSDF